MLKNTNKKKQLNVQETYIYKRRTLEYKYEKNNKKYEQET